MKNRTPETGAPRPPLPDFTPVPRKCKRHDGWTPARQKAFIEALAATGSVTHAARAVNMAKEGAYQLRLHPEGGEFRTAWLQALDFGVNILVDATMERAIHGVPVPIFHNGQQVGERRWYNDRLAMFHMRHRLPERYGALNPPGGGTKHPDTRAREAEEEEEWIDDGDETAEIIAERLYVVNLDTHARWKNDPAKRAAWEELNGMPFDSLLLHPNKMLGFE